MELEQFGIIREEKVETAFSTKTCFTWVIEDFESYSNDSGICSRSPVFYSGPNHEYKWTLDIYLDGVVFGQNDYIAIDVVLFDKDQHKHENFIVKCSILDKNSVKHCSHFVEMVNVRESIEDFVYKEYLSERRQLLLPNGVLSVVCEILDSSANDSSKNAQLKVFETLFDTKKYCDFKLVLKGKEFSVHRSVLGPQSPVFEAMFETNMRESKEGKVDIDDIEPHIMEKLLRFVYTEEIDFENSADLVLVAAEKYQLESLKLRCENELAKGISMDNIYDVLLLADQNNASKLKKKAMDYFDANIKKLAATDDFKASIKSFPKDLLTDIIAACALNR